MRIITRNISNAQKIFGEMYNKLEIFECDLFLEAKSLEPWILQGNAYSIL